MTTANDLAMPRTVADLEARYAKLQRLKVDVETELVAIEDGLRVAGVLPAGRPRIRTEFTTEEAREAHTRYVRGVRDPATIAGHRQYARDWARARRSR